MRGHLTERRPGVWRITVSDRFDDAGADHLDADVTRDTLSVLLKYQQDVEKVQRELVVNEA